VTTVEAGIELATRAIDSGAAQRVLDELVARTNGIEGSRLCTS
jgi:anthranilate phosphoribosyltransferase